MVNQKPVELLSKHLFWDIDSNLLEWERSKKTIIERVIERGSLEEWVCIVRVYTLEGIVNTAKTFRTMSPIDLNFIATISLVLIFSALNIVPNDPSFIFSINLYLCAIIFVVFSFFFK